MAAWEVTIKNIGLALGCLIALVLCSCAALGESDEKSKSVSITCGEGTELNLAGDTCLVSEAVLKQSFEAGVASVDITTDNQAAYDEGFLAGAESIDITEDNQEAFEEGVASVDITTDNQEVCEAGGGIWDGEACSITPNCFLMGLCGVDGAYPVYGISGPYSLSNFEDAIELGPDCTPQYNYGVTFMFSWCPVHPFKWAPLVNVVEYLCQ